VTGRLLGPAAALSWTLFCIRWFDVAASWRPRWLAAVPVALLGAAVLTSAAALLVRHRRVLFTLPSGGRGSDLWLAVGLACAFRGPMAWTAAVGYTTPDGSLSGLVALRIREGVERLVFVPSVPYSGSLKSHLTALLSLAIDLHRAFALSSVLFYGAFVAALYALAATVLDGRRPLLAALYAVFAPAFVTHYSLSNDGNYVEVLALGTFALWLAVRARPADDRSRDVLAWAAGTALGLAFWCHILAVIHGVAVGAAFVAAAPRRAGRTVPRLVAGVALGYLPGLLWNAVNGGESFLYLLPGGKSVGSLERGPVLPTRVWGILRTQVPVLLGYDAGYPPLVAALLAAVSLAAAAALVLAFVSAARRAAASRDFAWGTVLSFTVVNVLVAALALPYIEGNPRYLLFLVAPIAVLLADTLGRGRRRALLAALLVSGAAASFAQWPSSRRSDERWRAFVAELESAGVTHCHTDFYLAAKIDMLSEERVVCAADLGPTMTEYFRDYPVRVAQAPRAALVAVNATAADKIGRRLERLGIAYERRDLMKPVLLPAANIPPAELFPR
jgi:hypothetical protein